MLIRVLLFGALLLPVACESSQQPPTAQRTRTDLVPVYFVDGHGLSAEYRVLPPGPVEEGLFQLLRDGPDRGSLRSFVPSDARLIAATESEARRGLILEPSEEFWSLPDGERFAAAAQIAFTFATLEEGKSILLLDGAAPGSIVDGGGRELEQPLERGGFGGFRPWIVVQQPPAGARVSGRLPVLADVRAGEGSASISVGDEVVDRSRLVDGRALLTVPAGLAGELSLQLTDGRHSVTVPLRRL